MTFTPDRRPISVNWNGPAKWSASDIRNVLGQRLRTRPALTADRRGARFLLQAPAGHGADHSAANYWPLPECPRRALAFAVKNARRARPMTFGITGHLQWNGAHSQDPPYSYPFNPQDRDEYFGEIVLPWRALMSHLYEWGMEGAVGDASVRATTLAFADRLRDFSIHPVVEGLPLTTGPGGKSIVDRAMASQVACWCTRAFPGSPGGIVEGENVSDLPEVHVLLQGPNDGAPMETEDQIIAYLELGYIVGPTFESDELVKKCMEKTGLPAKLMVATLGNVARRTLQ